ncbi:MAG: pyridoxal phosphate-dependent aminotransferase [Candidatus Diapherotrites archaeon]|nr:pyridoxal phosphate-dependent aminotransferase [Candidatus Diapherotrites archaeon]
MQISERVSQLPDSTFVRILRLAAETKDVLSLGPGEPDFTTPEHIREATKKALDEEKTHYSPISGRMELKEAIAEKFKRDYNVDVSPENEVIVTCGSTEAIMLGLASVVDPGEEVLVPDPSFIIYEPLTQLFNGYPVSVPLKEENGFQLFVEDVKNAIKDPKRTRAIIICNPSNPTGTVLDKKRLEELADIAVEYDLLVMVDEAYEKLVYGKKHISMLSLNGMKDYVLALQSFSKTYAMPGYRIGYAVGSEKIIKAMTDLHIHTSLCAPTMSQIAATAALKGSQDCVEEMRTSYDRRRKFMYKRLKEIDGFSLNEPEGAFYMFPSIHFNMTSNRFCEYLLKEAKVLTVPGTEFGRYGEGFIRLSYATKYELIEEAMDRIEKACKKLT